MGNRLLNLIACNDEAKKTDGADWKYVDWLTPSSKRVSKSNHLAVSRFETASGHKLINFTSQKIPPPLGQSILGPNGRLPPNSNYVNFARGGGFNYVIARIKFKCSCDLAT